MSTDRELLELAAKAIGCRAVWANLDGRFDLYRSDGFVCMWNPLTDDGDALRLAVKLRMCVSVEHDAQAALWRGDDLEAFNEPLGDDECAAVRRAIVRAAAAIGESMP